MDSNRAKPASTPEIRGRANYFYRTVVHKYINHEEKNLLMYISDSCPFCLFSEQRPSGGKLPNCSKTLKMVLSQTWLPRPFKQQETSPKRCTNRVLTSLCSEKRITALPGREVGAGAVPSGWSARPASSQNARNMRKYRVVNLVAPPV